MTVDEETRALVFSPDFQRLRYVRLCNINSLYLTGASEPKRFEHCLGVYHLADLWARSRRLAYRETRIIRAAALLHDMFTGPFGHSFQYVLEDNTFEQQFEHANPSTGIKSGFHQNTRAGAHFAGRPFVVPKLLGDIADEVYDAVRGDGPIGAIISGTLDLDNLDNVVRLAFHMGLCSDNDRTLPLRLAPMLEPRAGGLSAPTAAEPLIESWFDLRRRSYEFLLLDRGEFSAKAMLTLAVETAASAHLLGVDDWKLTDDALLDALETRSVGEHQLIGQIVKRLRLGDLFDCIDVWTTPETTAYSRLADAACKRELERQIEDECLASGGPRMKVCLHYILDQKKTCRSITFHDNDAGGVKTVGYNSDQLLVGAFAIGARAARLSITDRRLASSAARAVLARVGLATLKAAPEPLAVIEQTSDLLIA